MGEGAIACARFDKATMEVIMDKPDSQSRRQLLQALASAGAAVTAAAALPASAQENAARPRGGSGNQATIARTLADYAVKLRYDDLPSDVVRTVKRTILDTIGCAIGGYEAGPSQIAIKLARNVNATPGATILCSGAKTRDRKSVV